MSDESGKWFWCLDHKTVEPYAGCKSSHRLGPYETAEVAEHALETVAERNEEWDAEDRWDDEDDE